MRTAAVAAAAASDVNQMLTWRARTEVSPRDRGNTAESAVVRFAFK